MLELCARNEICKVFCGRSRVVGMGWLVGLLQVGPVCAHVPMLEGLVAIVGCLDIFGC